MANRNLTLTLPDELVRRAKVLAAQRDTSVSALVGSLLESAVGRVDGDGDLWSREEQIMRDGTFRVGSITWERDDLHDRRL